MCTCRLDKGLVHIGVYPMVALLGAASSQPQIPGMQGSRRGVAF